ncbi:hypothetical protein [Methyloceanibacter sp.]|uniref:hypothetical protein n=1 Tax=Methyloceanibacter sp. TaxID=1965321 RepID=UPI002D6B7A98|nr:hypothetical protein [Methyloceanibacter sp.]HZP10467.1 hypothetical protein [Methyloceanibacter sp.]
MLGWRRFVWVGVGGSAAILVLLALFILAMNPYGNLPRILFAEHAITDINQRFQFPALIRSGAYDSAVIGASDSRLLRPAELERVFGGRFVNLAINAGQAYEQYRLADLFMREVAHPRTLLIGLDHVWCDDDADTVRTTFRGFPDWMYDDNSWNDFGYMLNASAIEISGRRLGVALGINEARFPAGYEVFTPPETAYDPVKVRHKLWKDEEPHAIVAAVPAYVPTSTERSRWRFPALAWLDEITRRFEGRVVLAFMPVHVASQPLPGSVEAARLDECKARIVAVAKGKSAPVIDFDIASEITTDDANYWDPLHYRVGIAERIVADIERALATRQDDPAGDWRYLDGPRAVAVSSD